MFEKFVGYRRKDPVSPPFLWIDRKGFGSPRFRLV